MFGFSSFQIQRETELEKENDKGIIEKKKKRIKKISSFHSKIISKFLSIFPIS